MMFIYIITDEWNDGSQRQHIIGSNFQFSKKEFNKIVEETEKEMEESDTIYNSFFGKGREIAKYLALQDNRFFPIAPIKKAIIKNNNYEDDGDDIIIFGTHVGSFDELVETVEIELSGNDYHDEEGNLPTIKDIDDLSDFVECHESLDDDEWEQFEKLLNEAQNFNGIEIIDEGPCGGAFSSEADYWRYRMDPNY